MIDLHCHLLPGVDDGAEDLDESLAMARLAVADGIRSIVVTPHFLNGVYHHSPVELRERFFRLQDFLDGQQVALSLYPGADIHLAPDLIRNLERPELPSINNHRYLLLELPSFALPSALHDTLFQIRTKGFTPIITHPERNGSIQQHPDQLIEMKRFGALAQVTAMSLTGGFGKKVSDCAAVLLEKGLVQVMASDAHSPKGRPPILSAGLKAAADLIGRDAALRLVTVHPERILAGEPWPEEEFSPRKEPSRRKKPSFYSRFFH
jgi:protein-tyrosine phosphatase